MKFKVTGKSTQGTQVTLEVTAGSKHEVMNNPVKFGFRTINYVKQVK